MERPKITFLLIFTLFCLSSAAQRQIQRTLQWNGPDPALAKATSATPAQAPMFQGAYTDAGRQELPFFHETLALTHSTASYAVTLGMATYASLTRDEVVALPGLGTLGPEPEIHSELSWYRKRPMALIDLYPYRKNPFTGQVEKLVSFTLNVDEKGGAALDRKSNIYPDHSKMASGEWYRFTLVQDGVYALDYAFLQDLGVNGPVASDQINVYGNHHGQLPYKNNDWRPTDLVTNAILVEDGGDGQFGPGDRILFHATGPHRWIYAEAEQVFCHIKHVFSDSADYFVGIGVEPPKRMADIALSSDPATHQVTAFDDRQFIENDNVNLIKSGRRFFGETFDLVDSYNYSFNLPNIRTDSPVRLVITGAARTVGSAISSFQFNVSGMASSSESINGIGTGYTGPYAAVFDDTLTFLPTQATFPITVTFNPYDPITSVGWVDFLEVNARRDLKFVGDQLLFRDLASRGSGYVSEFTLSQASSVSRIWEITNPTNVGNVPYTDGGSSKNFRLSSDSLRQFIAFKNSNYLTPTAVGQVPNQDLHGLELPVDLTIVCPPAYQAEAQRLAAHREQQGLNVLIVSPQQIFNEFSSGMRDATAIKRFMKMLYDRAGTDTTLFSRFLLLMGDGSYNNISLSSSNQNLIPSYQTANSWNLSLSYTSDDYFGLLDDAEGEATSDLVDIGIGRLPASSREQARQMVDKIINYDRLTLLSTPEQSCALGGDGGASDWRTWVVFASDDQEGDGLEGWIHMDQSDDLATRVDNEHPEMNVVKIFLDAYQQYTTPGGERYPEAEADLRDRVQKGALIVNYVGHGGEVGWAHERFLDNSTILGWTNNYRLPLFMTATCEFSRWDDPGRTSAGEYVILNPNGGGVGLMTTTRLAYSNQNFQLSNDFYDNVFKSEDGLGRPWLFGDIYRETKRQITIAQGGQTNHRNFALLGDPSTRLAHPRMQVTTTSVTDTLGNPVDTLKALATVRVSGIVADNNGNQLADFNGLVIPTVFDKRVSQSTLANDGGLPYSYTVRKNIVYRGKATVTNGAFTFTFVVPKDIAYQVGPGRISYYAESYDQNACGYTHEPLVGATATDIAADDTGPRIELFMNDERFVNGGITNEDPLLLGKLFDANGINTTGNSIGHDLVAVLDANTDREVVLNDYYEADLDTYQSGKVRYRYSDLAEGTHTLTFKAWDVHNNSSTKSTEFVVASSEELALAHVLNYPNPFTTRTEFYFEHNRPCSTLDVQVQVFTVSGRLVKTITREVSCEGFRAEPLAWDGLDDHGDKLGRGVYVYRLHIADELGEKAEKFEKLVILR